MAVGDIWCVALEMGLCATVMLSMVGECEMKERRGGGAKMCSLMLCFVYELQRWFQINLHGVVEVCINNSMRCGQALDDRSIE